MHSQRTVYTIGYGSRELSELLNLLVQYGVELVVDVRRWTKSKRRPEFSSENLKAALEARGLGYAWIPELGGYRKFGVDVEDYDIAQCFESEGFRAYATYITRNPAAKPYLEKLVELAKARTVALFCREAVPWLCHRKILSDYLVARGFRVVHILDKDRVVEHKLSKCAVVEQGELKYL